MMSTLFSTVAKISKLEQIAREAAANSSSSDSSTSSLGNLMNPSAAAVNPWFHEARYIIEQQQNTKKLQNNNSEANEHKATPAKPSQQPAAAMAAIFPSHQSASGE